MKMGLAVILALGGVVALVVIGWLAAPLFYDKEVNEALPVGVRASAAPAAGGVEPSFGVETRREMPAATEASAVSLAGQFAGFDRLHQASGTVRLLEIDGTRYLRFEDDFEVTNGPDLFVHLGRNGEYVAKANLGRLKGNVGSQNYEIPSSIDLSQYDEAWVWCRAFAVPFGKAELR